MFTQLQLLKFSSRKKLWSSSMEIFGRKLDLVGMYFWGHHPFGPQTRYCVITVLYLNAIIAFDKNDSERSISVSIYNVFIVLQVFF